MSKEFRRDSGRNEGVRRCLLGVRNVGECLWLPLAMSRGDMGVSGDVYGCLGGVRGSWKVLGDLRGCLVVFSLQFQEVTNEILDIFQ